MWRELHPHLLIRRHTRYVRANLLLRAAQNAGVVLVANVGDQPDYDFAGCCRLIGIQYRHQPLTEAAIDLIHLESVVAQIANAMAYGRVLLHGDTGYNRSGLVAVLALIRTTHQPPLQLLAAARQLQPRFMLNKNYERLIEDYKVPVATTVE